MWINGYKVWITYGQITDSGFGDMVVTRKGKPIKQLLPLPFLDHLESLYERSGFKEINFVWARNEIGQHTLAITSPKDSFDKKRGRQIALDRLMIFDQGWVRGRKYVKSMTERLHGKFKIYQE
jgi:hypothetical protein